MQTTCVPLLSKIVIAIVSCLLIAGASEGTQPYTPRMSKEYTSKLLEPNIPDNIYSSYSPSNPYSYVPSDSGFPSSPYAYIKGNNPVTYPYFASGQDPFPSEGNSFSYVAPESSHPSAFATNPYVTDQYSDKQFFPYNPSDNLFPSTYGTSGYTPKDSYPFSQFSSLNFDSPYASSYGTSTNDPFDSYIFSPDSNQFSSSETGSPYASAYYGTSGYDSLGTRPSSSQFSSSAFESPYASSIPISLYDSYIYSPDSNQFSSSALGSSPYTYGTSAYDESSFSPSSNQFSNLPLQSPYASPVSGGGYDSMSTYPLPSSYSQFSSSAFDSPYASTFGTSSFESPYFPQISNQFSSSAFESPYAYATSADGSFDSSPFAPNSNQFSSSALDSPYASLPGANLNSNDGPLETAFTTTGASTSKYSLSSGDTFSSFPGSSPFSVDEYPYTYFDNEDPLLSFGAGNDDEFIEFDEYGDERVGPPVDGEYYLNGHEMLDTKGKFLLKWEIDSPGKIVTFNVTIQISKGWFGLGLSRDGTMKNADIIIGGMKGHVSQPYVEDFYSNFERKIFTDDNQDWNLVYAESLDNAIHMQISRRLDTCDPNDYAITEDLIHIIWAYGETEEYDYHFDKRGSFPVYLLDPILKPRESSLSSWRISKSTLLAPRLTSYWCTIHKAPQLFEKNHIIQADPYFPNAVSLTRAHHVMLWKCAAPSGVNAKDIFEHLLSFEGEECHFAEDHVIPINLCKNLMVGWAIGGKSFVLPHNVGLPIGEAEEEYWMLEVHYNNNEELPVTVTGGLDLLYTNNLRQNDGGGLLVAYERFGLAIVPPISARFEMHGICSTTCTEEMFPPEGVEIVSVLLHSHNAGKKMKLHHFREGTELPWIIKDDNYDNKWQQTRNLFEPRLVLPGDQLVVQCIYDNTWTNKSTLTGFAAKDEMCVAALLINKRIPYFSCHSQVSQKRLLGVVGVQHYEWDIKIQERVVTSPSSLAGRLLSDVCDERDWTKSDRYKLQGITTHTTQNCSCPQILLPVPRQVINHEAVSSEILKSGKGIGDGTLGSQGVLNLSSVVYSSAIYPYKADKYSPERYCPDPDYGFYNSYFYSPEKTSTVTTKQVSDQNSKDISGQE